MLRIGFTRVFIGLGVSIVPLKEIEYGLYGDPIIIYPEPYSIYLRGDYMNVLGKSPRPPRNDAQL